MGITLNHQLESMVLASGVLALDSNTGAVVLPKGAAAARPSSGRLGMLRFNTDSNFLEFYITGWLPVTAGPATSTVNAIATYAGTAGSVLQNSAVTIDTSGNVSGVAQLNALVLNATGTSLTLKTTTSGNIVVFPGGTGYIQLANNRWPLADGGAAQGLLTNGSGQLSWSTLLQGTNSLSELAVVGNLGSARLNLGLGSAAVLNIGSGLYNDGSGNLALLNGRTKLTQAVNYYVATTGNDTTGNGGTAAPWATLQHAYNWVLANIDTGGNGVTVNVANGAYAPVSMQYPLVGGGVINFVGNASTPANCVIYGINLDAFVVGGGAQASIRGFQVQTTGTFGSGLSAYGLASAITVSGAMNFGTCVNAHKAAGACASIVDNSNAHVISAGATWHMFAFESGRVYESTGSITINGSPTFTIFASATSGGTILAYGETYSGSCNGTRFYTINGGSIQTNSNGNPNYFPGSAAGEASNSGFYDYVNKTISTSAPSGGIAGDVWYQI